MPVTVSTVGACDLEGFAAAADRLARVVGDLDHAIAGARRAVAHLRADWRGAVAEPVLAAADRELLAQEQLRARLDAIQRTLASGADALDATRAGIGDLTRSLRTRGWVVAEDGSAVAPPLPPLLAAFAPGFTTILKRLLDLFDRIDTATAAQLRAATGAEPAV